MRCPVLLLVVVLLAGCESLSFYSQAIKGQWQILNAREGVDEVIARGEASPATLRGLALSREIRSFAQSELGIDPGRRYGAYVDLQRESVVWNVFAADPYAIAYDRWCYPLVGCAPYRGFFREADARRLAEALTAQGLETYVGGVPAYSTLGWFADPLLNTFIEWPEPDLVNLLLHELAHGRVWVKGDVSFNESFATFVAEEGLRSWFERQNKPEAFSRWQADRRAWIRLRTLLLELKERLEAIYAEDAADRSRNKAQAIAQFKACYAAHRPQLGAGRFDPMVEQDLNNAFLVSLGAYRDRLPAFAALFKQSGRRWDLFFNEVDEIGRLDEGERVQALDAVLAEQPEHDRRNDEDAEQIQCESFTRHGGHGKGAG